MLAYILMLQHPHIVGTLELSTAYTWTAAEESLKVCTHSGAVHQSGWEWEKRSHERLKGYQIS